jgi:hypothetical protein
MSLLVSGLWLLSACEAKETTKDLDFQFALPTTWRIVDIARLDTDGDAENEWVLLYTFDDPQDPNFGPVRCAVYDVAHREPRLPIIYPYHLQAPGWTYLGEGAERTSVRLADVVSTIPDPTDTNPAFKQEVVLESVSGEGFVNRVSIFRWRDNVPPELRKRTDPNEVLILPNEPPTSGEWYQCVGMFEASLQVKLDVDRVEVWDRVNDRSQFAKITTYQPLPGSPTGYLNDVYQRIDPISVCLDFAFGMPENVAQSPYPEKVVMAFQKSFAGSREYALSFLTAEAKQVLGSMDPGWLHSPCVTQVSYGPHSELESEVQSFEVGEESPIRAQVGTQLIYRSEQQVRQAELTWRLVRIDNAWKIEDFIVLRQ